MLVSILVGIPIAIVVGVAANLLTPVVRDRQAARSASRRRKRIEAIHEEIAATKYLRAKPSAAAAYLVPQVVIVLAAFVGAVGFLTTDLVFQAVRPDLETQIVTASVGGLVLLAVAAYYANRLMNTCRAITYTGWYRERTTKELRKLGEEPSDDEDDE